MKGALKTKYLLLLLNGFPVMLVIRSTKFIVSSNFSVLIRAMRHGMLVTWRTSASSVQVAYRTSKLSKYMWLLAILSLPELEQKKVILLGFFLPYKGILPRIGVGETITRSHSGRGSSAETCSAS